MTGAGALGAVLFMVGTIWAVNELFKSAEIRERQRERAFKESFKRDVSGNHRNAYRARTIKVRGRRDYDD